MSRGFATKELRVPGRVAINRTVRCGGNIIGEGGAVLFRRSILEKTGLFGSEIFYVFDLALWYRMLLHGDLHCLGQVVSAFRLSEASESTRVLRSQLRDNLVFLRRIYGDPAYRLSLPNYVCGMMNATLIAMAKRVLYGLWVK